MIEGLHVDSSVSVQTLKEKHGTLCQAAFIGMPIHPSTSQQQVNDTLRVMYLSVENEFRFPKSDYSIDTRVYDMCVNAKCSTGTVSGLLGMRSDDEEEYNMIYIMYLWYIL